METATNSDDKPNKFYIRSIIALTFVVPMAGFIVDYFTIDAALSFESFSRWFIFSAVGLRLFFAGMKQIKDPEFTAKQIFKIDGSDSFPILRELGFANICFGLVGIVSFFVPEWRIVCAFASGLYFGFAGLQHGSQKSSGINEKVALWTDLLIFVFLLIYFIQALC